ncbi:hypothetical protein [Nonomuraea fuscirosea]|uniref:hypothetical protein n=1 Tax=Nonomuraea fuscirosea TaxID=1291556 RepID=UPI0034323C4F
MTMLEDDDLLIERLRARACDPARRFDEATVPSEWVEDRFGKDRVERAWQSGYGIDSEGTIYFPAGAEEAVEYYRDRLPDLLGRLYTEVGDGGFGPDARGFGCLRYGNRDSRGVVWPSVMQLYRRDRKDGLPASWFELTPGGCSMYWYASLTEPDNPVSLFDADAWDGQGPRIDQGIKHTTSLREWLWTWADGGDVWAPVLGR